MRAVLVSVVVIACICLATIIVFAALILAHGPTKTRYGSRTSPHVILVTVSHNGSGWTFSLNGRNILAIDRVSALTHIRFDVSAMSATEQSAHRPTIAELSSVDSDAFVYALPAGTHVVSCALCTEHEPAYLVVD